MWGCSIEESRHLFTIKGKNAESFVRELACKSFLIDWCYPNPIMPDGKELCDLLVIFDKIAIIWQIKNLKLNSKGHYRPSEVKKNIRQLSGARRKLFDLKIPINLENPRRSNVIFDPSQINEIYLISALLGEGEDYFPFKETTRVHTVHVFTRSFTEAVLTELDTIADFISYLRGKESLLNQNKQITIVGGEEQLLGFYLLNNRSFSRLAKATHVMLNDDIWHGLQDDPQYQAKCKEDKISYGWDSIINRAHECSSEYELVARELARPTRFQRRFLSKCFYDAHVVAHEDNRANAFRRVLSFKSVTYCFLFCDEKESHNTRKSMLYATCFVARGKYPDNELVLGIATEKHFAPSCSYYFLLLRMPTWTNENQSKMENIQNKFGILVNPAETRMTEKEYPDIE